MTTETFTRKLKNLEGMWYRLDKGLSGGRNSASTEATMKLRYRELDDAIRADAQTEDAPLCTFLDNNPKLSERWNRLERREFGLPL